MWVPFAWVPHTHANLWANRIHAGASEVVLNPEAVHQEPLLGGLKTQQSRPKHVLSRGFHFLDREGHFRGFGVMCRCPRLSKLLRNELTFQIVSSTSHALFCLHVDGFGPFGWTGSIRSTYPVHPFCPVVASNLGAFSLGPPFPGNKEEP